MQSIIYLDSNNYACLISNDGPPDKRFKVTVLNDEVDMTDRWMLGPWRCFGDAVEAIDMRYV